MQFSDYLTAIPAEINQRLEAHMQTWAASTQAYAPLVQDFCTLFADACQDGKRLRATLVKLGFDMSGGDAQSVDIYPAALAYEIFQTAILAHDDIIDKSPLRRGKPTLYKILQDRCAAETGKDAATCQHYGVSQTICLGDMGLFLSMQLLTNCDFDPVLKNRGLSFFIKTVIDTIAGEIIDVELPYRGRVDQVSVDDLIAICRYKTARYTITGPLTLGVLLAGSSHDMLPTIAAYGDNLGIAFQIKDDMLGIFADEKTIGKSVTSDIEEGKLTLPYFYAIRGASTEQRSFLDKHYGTGPITSETYETIKRIFIDTGAKAETERVMTDYMIKAVHAIDALTPDTHYRMLLKDLADYMITRVK